MDIEIIPEVKPPFEVETVIERSTGKLLNIKKHRFNPELHKRIDDGEVVHVISIPETTTAPDVDKMPFFELRKYAKEKGLVFDNKTTKVELLEKLKNV
jgi:hypothetical protein